MKPNSSHLITRTPLLLLAAILFMVGSGSSALGQAPPGAGAPAITDPKRETHDVQNREFQLRNPETEVVRTQINQQRLLAAIELVKNDYKRIQIIRNDLVTDLVAKKPHNYKLIAERAGEIHRRAQELKTYLMPPVPQENEKVQKLEFDYKREEIEGALVKLCNTIFNFTQNPILKTPDVVDVQQSAKAGRELLLIIDLSGNIKRSAEKLGKE